MASKIFKRSSGRRRRNSIIEVDGFNVDLSNLCLLGPNDNAKDNKANDSPVGKSNALPKKKAPEASWSPTSSTIFTSEEDDSFGSVAFKEEDNFGKPYYDTTAFNNHGMSSSSSGWFEDLPLDQPDVLDEGLSFQEEPHQLSKNEEEPPLLKEEFTTSTTTAFSEMPKKKDPPLSFTASPSTIDSAVGSFENSTATSTQSDLMPSADGGDYWRDDQGRPMMEVTPGEWMALCGCRETWGAYMRGEINIVPCTCCAVDLICVEDANLVLCCDCGSISAVPTGATGNPKKNGKGLVGMGLTVQEAEHFAEEEMRERSKAETQPGAYAISGYHDSTPY